VVGLLLLGLLLPPSLGQAAEERWGGYSHEQREKLIQEMQLTPEKAKEFEAVAEKYATTRQEIADRIKKNQAELEKALATSPADEAKIKELVGVIAADHDKLLDSLKAQRREEMALLTPVQQGRFLMALKKWHEEMRERFEKKK